MDMWSSDKKSVMDKALDKIDSPKGWLVLAGSVVGMMYLHKKDMLNMWSSDKRDLLEKIIDKVSD